MSLIANTSRYKRENANALAYVYARDVDAHAREVHISCVRMHESKYVHRESFARER